MNLTEKIVFEKLKSVFKDVKYTKGYIVVGNRKLKVLKSYKGTIWIYKTKYDELKKNSIDIITLHNDELIIVPIDDIKRSKLYGINLKIKEGVKIEVSEETRRRLMKYGTDFDEVINELIDYREGGDITNMNVVSPEFLPLIFAIKTLKNGSYQLLDDLRKIRKGEVVPKESIEELEKWKMIFHDKTTGKIYVVAHFVASIKDDVIEIKLIYDKKFCRYYCSNIANCKLFLENIARDGIKFGTTFEIPLEDFKNKSIEEIIGGCVLECMQN